MRTEVWEIKILGVRYACTATIKSSGKVSVHIDLLSKRQRMTVEKAAAIRRGLETFCRAKVQALFPTKFVGRGKSTRRGK